MEEKNMNNNPNTENSYSVFGTETGRTSTKHPNHSASPYPSHISEPLPNPPNHTTLHDQLNFGTPIHFEKTSLLGGITETEIIFTNPNLVNNRPNVLTLTKETKGLHPTQN